jgi:hypothetical protein
VTLEEAGGDLDANHEELRRVDIAVAVEESTTTTAGMSRATTSPHMTTEWAIKVNSVSTGGLGVYFSRGHATLKNRLTGQTADGSWWAGGGGGGSRVPFSSSPPMSGPWSDFRTNSLVSFDAFDGEMIRFIHVDAGGRSVAYFSFPAYMSRGVSVGGYGGVPAGIHGTGTAGTWTFDGPIPPAPIVGEEVEIPVETTAGSNYGHRVLFATGSADISSSEMGGLRTFVLETLPG